MKKKYPIILIFLVLLSACGTSNPTTPSKSTLVAIEVQNTPIATNTVIPLTATLTPIPPTQTLVPESAFIKGVTLNYSSGEKLDSVDAKEVTQRYIIPSGANHVALIPTCWSTNMMDTDIVCSNEPIEGGVPPISDIELINSIQYLHSMGLRVLLKPQALIQTVHISNIEQKSRHWNEAQWDEWTDSYSKFIVHYAQIAEDNRVDIFVIGNEQEDTTQSEKKWRRIITAVRNVYHGPITYAANAWSFEASQIKFWDALDYIGSNGYQFGFVNKKDTTIDDMVHAWQPYIQRLEEISNQYEKQVIITEIGARSMQNFNTGRLNDADTTLYDGQEQANYYKAFFEALKDKPWLKGIILWDITTDPLQGGLNDISYTYIAKPAEQTVHEYFSGLPLTPTIIPDFIESSIDSIWIYQENLLNGWHSWNEPEAKTVPNLHSPNSYQGSFAISVPLSKYKELQLVYDTPYIKMSKYKWIDFYIMVGTHKPKTLFVLFGHWTPQAYTFSRKASVVEYIEDGQYKPNTWQNVKIPLLDLGITDQIFNEFHIMGCDWPCVLDTHVDDIYIDDIRLVAGK